jgi:CubicO group peptidase (beta-lactamase class C family)
MIVVSGKSYLYKGVANTYLKGRTGVDINDYLVFENRTIKVGETKEWPLGADYNRSKIPSKYISDVEKFKTIAYLVIKDDSIRYEEYWDGYSDTSHTSSFSMAKTFISILVGIAVDEGKIKSIDQPVGDFLPEYKDGDKSKVTIRHLLTMSSGINFTEDYKNPFSFPAEAYYGTDLRKLVYKYDATQEPGKYFDYLSGNTLLLCFALSKATGMSVSDYASEKLWKPIQAEYDAYWSLDRRDGDEKAYCCFNSNVRDFARIGKVYLDSGRWNGKQIVPEKYVFESIQPAPVIDRDFNLKNNRYGYSWWLLPGYKGHNIFYARGILGQYIIMIPDLDMIVVRLGKERAKEQINGHPVDLYQFIDAALEMYSNPLPLPLKGMEIPQAPFRAGVATPLSNQFPPALLSSTTHSFLKNVCCQKILSAQRKEMGAELSEHDVCWYQLKLLLPERIFPREGRQDLSFFQKEP